MARRTFEDWLIEMRGIVRENLETELEELPEFDRADAKAYYKEGSTPSLYFKECLAEHCEDGDSIEEIMREL